MAAVNLSTLAPATPIPTPTQPAYVNVVNQSAGSAAPSNSGAVAVSVAAKQTLALLLVSPFPSNTVTLNGTVPTGWSALPAGLFAQVIPDEVGTWTIEVTTPGAALNSVTIQGY